MDAFITATLEYPPPIERPPMLWVCQDFQTPYYNYETRKIYAGANGTPATCKAKDSASEKMTKRYQELWYAAICHFAPGRSEDGNMKAWGSVTHSAKAFTNKTGTDILHDYIRGLNEDKEDARQENIVCTGNTLIDAGREMNIGGEGCRGVLALDRDNLPTFDALINHPYWASFITAATVTTIQHSDAPNKPSTTIAPNGTRIIDPFPDNQTFYPLQWTPVPFASYAGEKVEFMGLACRIKYILKNRLTILPPAEFGLSPYVRKL